MQEEEERGDKDKPETSQDKDQENVPSPVQEDEEEDVENVEDSLHELHLLKQTVSKLVGKVGNVASLGVERPFQNSESPLIIDKTSSSYGHKYLYRSELGHVRLVFDSESLEAYLQDIEPPAGATQKVTFEDGILARRAWLNFIGGATIEIASLVEGMGRRTQDIPNAAKGYHLGALSENGFVLGRSGMSASAEDSSAWLPSVFEYRPFSSDFNSLMKSSWVMEVPMGESLVLVSCGSDHIATVTDVPHANIRLYSLTGSLHYCVSSGHGSPLTLVSCGRGLLFVEHVRQLTHPHTKLGTKATPLLHSRSSEGTSIDFHLGFDQHVAHSLNEYHVTFWVASDFPLSPHLSGIHLLHEGPLTLFGVSDKLKGIFLTDRLLPICVTSSGRVMALLCSSHAPAFQPHEKEHFNEFGPLESFAAFKESTGPLTVVKQMINHGGPRANAFVPTWTVVVSCVLDHLQKTSAKLSSTFSVLRVADDHVDVNFFRKETLEICSLDGGQRIPFRFPLAFSEATTAAAGAPLAARQWRDFLEVNPNLSEKGGVQLPAQLWDEIRLRRSLVNLEHELWLAMAGVDGLSTASMNERSLLVREMRKIVELNTMRQIQRLIEAGQIDGALEVCHHLAFDSTLNRLITQANEKGLSRTLGQALELLKTRRAMVKHLRHSETDNEDFPQEAKVVTVAPSETVPPSSASEENVAPPPTPALGALLKSSLQRLQKSAASSAGHFGRPLDLDDQTAVKRRRVAEDI